MKALNVVGIIFAWILSIALVVMLVAAPLAFSALSLLDTDNLTEIVSGAILGNNKSAEAKEKVVLQNLSAEAGTVVEEKPENAAGGIIQGILGNDVSEEMLNKMLTSDAMSELLGAYTEDLVNAIAGKNKEKEFTPELLVEVVQENLDEIVEIVEASGMPLTDEQKQQLKSQIGTAVEDKAEEIVAAIPAPEEVKESIVDGNKEIELAFTILARKNTIKGAIVGIIVALSVLIFALRYPGLRGMRWLATNLFAAGGFNVLICVVLGLASSAVKGVTAGMNAIEGTAVDSVIGMLLSELTKGVVIRTVIIFVAAVALLVGYILLKPIVKKKKAAVSVEEPVPEEIPVFVPASVAAKQEVIAEPASQEDAAEEPTEEPAPTEEI